MSVKKKNYTSEFKSRVALCAIQGDLTLNEIAAKYGVHTTQINRWKQQALSFIKSGFTGNVQKMLKSEKELIDELYKQVGQMKCENDFLKKNLWK